MRLSALIFAVLTCGLVAAALVERRAHPVTIDDPNKVPGDSPLELCPGDHRKDIVTIIRVDLCPNPPKAGEDLQITAYGLLNKTVHAGAYVNITIKYGPIKLLTTTADLCDQIKNVNLTCPVEPGPLEISKTVALPAEIPPGKYHVFANVFNYDGEPITCLKADVPFNRKSLSFAGMEL